MELTGIKIERAKLSMKIYNNLGLPTVKKFKHMVSTDMISNCPISVVDINNDGNLYETPVVSLKGKSTSRKSRLIIKDGIQISRNIFKIKFKHLVIH